MKKLYMFFLALILSCTLTPFLSAATWSPDADMVLYNGKFITVDKDFSIVEAVAIKDGKFIVVDKKEEAMRYAGDNTKKIDLEGKTVIPGFIDSHLHMMSVGISLLKKVQLSHCRDMDCVLKAIQVKAQELGPGEWVHTSGQWHESQLKEKRLPTRTELDSVCLGNPVYVARGGHTTVVNSAAFKIAGITKDTLDPPGGEFKRNPVTGELTGLLFEHPAQSMIQKHMPRTKYEEVIEGIKLAMKELNQCGIVGVTEPGLYVGTAEFKAYYETWKKGDLSMRIRLMIRAREPKQIEAANRFLYQGFGDDMLKISGIKMLLDGGVETALLKDPYKIVHGEQEKEGYYGVQVLKTDTLRESCRLAAQHGWHVETHAVGDAAIELLVDTYGEINEEIPIKDLRWTVMHIFLPTQRALDKMKALGVGCTVQDHPTYLGANQVKYWGEERGRYAIPNRKLLDEGFIVGGGSDAPVVHWDPFLSLWWMVTRNTITAGVLGPDQKVTREEALTMYTQNSAYYSFEENVRGSIEPGKWADLAVLDRNYLSIPENDIKNIKVLKTMMGGKFVYEAK